VKHDIEYQEKWGIAQGPAQGLPSAVSAGIGRICKRIYRTLELDGYARLDFRLAPSGDLYFLEANPNPEIAEREEFATAAAHGGIPYPELLLRIVRLGLQRAGGAAP
jgi:D-alanine-D-alanine ligase